MSLYDLLACPACRVAVARAGDRLACARCGQTYPIIDGVPVMFPGGGVPAVEHEDTLITRSAYGWIPLVVLKSLLDSHVVLEIGSGTMTLDDPCIVRMDVTLTPYVDVVADMHALPFLPGSVDFIFSQAVVEHLRQPFHAADSMWEVLRDGGYVYHDCSFVFAYHGYPHHYFNATLSGLEQIFARYTPLRTGVGPHQMPSFALEIFLLTYLRESRAREDPRARPFVALLEQVLAQPLRRYDAYFSEEAARTVAAGTYFFGLKQATPDASILPPVVRAAWADRPELRRRYPVPFHIGTADNLLLWAKTEGRWAVPEIDEYLARLTPFNKRGPAETWDRSALKALPIIEPTFGPVPDTGAPPIPERGAGRGSGLGRLVAGVREHLRRRREPRGPLAPPSPPPPRPAAVPPGTARLTLSARELRPGDTLTLGIEAENPAGNPVADLYVGALLPGGRLAVVVAPDGSLTPAVSLSDPSEFTPARPAPPGFVLHAPSFAELRIPSAGVPPGTYQVFAALVRRGSLEGVSLPDILALDVAAATVAPMVATPDVVVTRDD